MKQSNLDQPGDALRAFAAAFDRHGIKISRQVFQALDDPGAYVTEHRRLLALRGIAKPVPRLAGCAFADALTERVNAFETVDMRNLCCDRGHVRRAA